MIKIIYVVCICFLCSLNSDRLIINDAFIHPSFIPDNCTSQYQASLIRTFTSAFFLSESGKSASYAPSTNPIPTKGSHPLSVFALISLSLFSHACTLAPLSIFSAYSMCFLSLCYCRLSSSWFFLSSCNSWLAGIQRGQLLSCGALQGLSLPLFTAAFHKILRTSMQTSILRYQFYS